MRKIHLSPFAKGVLVGAAVVGCLWLLHYNPVNPVEMSTDGGQAVNVVESTAVGKEESENAADMAGQLEAAQQPDNDRVSETEEQSAVTVQDVWDAASVYNGGDEVEYEGKIYRAKWWTQNEKPGQADVWEDTLIAARESVLESEENARQELEVTEPKPLSQEAWAEKQSDFKVVGYFPSWKEDTGKIRYDVLTHINYAFAIPTAEGGLLPLENVKTAQKIIREAHEKGVKVFLAVGGWSYHEVPLEPTFVTATENEEKTVRFAEEIVAMCEQYGFDGVDLDWEHPRKDGDSSRQYEMLVMELAERLHAQGKELSSAVISGATADGNIYYDAAAHTDKVLATVDWINVMAYDGGDGERHSSYEFAVNCGTYWREARGMPHEKVVLGVPFYARPSWAAYGEILETVPDARSSDKTDYNGMEVWYNGVSTIEKKTTYAMNQLGGIMIWEITQDSVGEQSLQNTIGKCVKGGT